MEDAAGEPRRARGRLVCSPPRYQLSLSSLLQPPSWDTGTARPLSITPRASTDHQHQIPDSCRPSRAWPSQTTTDFSLLRSRSLPNVGCASASRLCLHISGPSLLLVTVHPPPLPALPAHHPRSHSCPPARSLLQRSPLYRQSIPLTRYLAPHGRSVVAHTATHPGHPSSTHSTKHYRDAALRLLTSHNPCTLHSCTPTAIPYAYLHSQLSHPGPASLLVSLPRSSFRQNSTLPFALHHQPPPPKSNPDTRTAITVLPSLRALVALPAGDCQLHCTSIEPGFGQPPATRDITSVGCEL